MIILKKKQFSQRRYKKVINPSPNIYNHYTTPQSAIGIAKNGLKAGSTKIGLGVSTYKSTNDILVGKDFNSLNTQAQETPKKVRAGEFSLKKVKEWVDNDIPKNVAEQHLKQHGITSYLFYPSQYSGSSADPNNPVQAYSNIDGLHHGKVDRGTLDIYTAAFRKTRNPVRAVIDTTNSDIHTSKGTDTGEIILHNKTNIIPRNKIKYEIPNSGIGTRDSDIKHLRRYFKGHKGLVNPTRETMEALYGSKFPYLSQFKSETEL